MQEEIKAGDVVRLKSDKEATFTVGQIHVDFHVDCYHFDSASSKIVVSDRIPIDALTKAD